MHLWEFEKKDLFRQLIRRGGGKACFGHGKQATDVAKHEGIYKKKGVRDG